MYLKSSLQHSPPQQAAYVTLTMSCILHARSSFLCIIRRRGFPQSSWRAHDALSCTVLQQAYCVEPSRLPAEPFHSITDLPTALLTLQPRSAPTLPLRPAV